jgi:hypothetical protein
MAQERVRNPLVGVTEEVFPGDAVGTTIVFATVDSTGKVAGVVFGRDVTDLVPKIDSLRLGM